MEEKQIKFEEWGTAYIETNEKQYLATKEDVDNLARELNEFRYGDCKIRSVSFGVDKTIWVAYLFIFIGFLALSQGIRRSL